MQVYIKKDMKMIKVQPVMNKLKLQPQVHHGKALSSTDFVHLANVCFILKAASTAFSAIRRSSSS